MHPWQAILQYQLQRAQDCEHVRNTFAEQENGGKRGSAVYASQHGLAGLQLAGWREVLPTWITKRVYTSLGIPLSPDRISGQHVESLK